MDSNKLIYARVTSDPQSDQFDVVSKFKNLYQAGLIKVPYVASPATGSGPNPWCIDINFLPAFLDIPDFTNFESVTNIRAQEVENHYKNIDGPIVVFWSGGIDSTVILAAILKNFSKHLLERLVVKMTKDSYYENPCFFEKFIKNKIKYTTGPINLDSSSVIHGWGADSLWSDINSILLNKFSPGCIHLNPLTAPDILLQWLLNKIKNHDTVHWFYDMIIQNSTSSNVTLNNYDDFWWWWCYNYVYAGNYFYSTDYIELSCTTKIDIETFNKKNIAWYFSSGYRSWGLLSRSKVFDGSLRSHKLEAKNYIFSLDKNPWYRDHKFKLDSNRSCKNNQVISKIDTEFNLYWTVN